MVENKAEVTTNKDYEELRSMTKFIVNEKIRKFVEDFFDNKVPDYFKHIAASSTGKYHPAYTLGDGGLCRHVIAAARILLHITSLEYLRIDSIMRDKMLAAILLHDTFKLGIDGSHYTTRDHPQVAAHEIEKVAAEVNKIDSDRPSISRMVSTHMGQWTPKSKPGNRYEFLVHLADYLASRKDILIDFSIPAERREE